MVEGTTLGNDEEVGYDVLPAACIDLHGNTLVFAIIGLGAEAMRLAEAKRRLLDVVMCSECTKHPAKYLDTCFPYCWHFNLCQECYDRMRNEEDKR